MRVPLTLFALIALAGPRLFAQVPPPPGVFYATMSNASNGGPQCVIIGANGTATSPSRYNWGAGPLCGLSLQELMSNKQGVWKFVPLVADKYMITNASGPGGEQCLMFGGNGNDKNPTRYNWGPGPYCGLPGGRDALIANRQAVWRLVPLGTAEYALTNDSGIGGERCLIFGANGTGLSPERYNWGPGPFCGFSEKDSLLANPQAVWTIRPIDYTWQLGSLTNGTLSSIMVHVPFPPGASDVAATVSQRGSVVLNVGSTLATIFFQDKGYSSSCPDAYRRVLISMDGTQQWTYFYRVSAKLNVAVSATGVPTFTPASSNDRVVTGNVDLCP